MMINQKIAYLLFFSSFFSSLIGMDGPMYFAFMAHIQNMSKKPITYIPCWGNYNVCRELDPQIIPHNSTLPIAFGRTSDIFALLVAGQKHRIINMPDIVWINCNAPDIVWPNGYQPRDPNLAKRKANGYRIKLDDYPPTDDCVGLIQG